MIMNDLISADDRRHSGGTNYIERTVSSRPTSKTVKSHWLDGCASKIRNNH